MGLTSSPPPNQNNNNKGGFAIFCIDATFSFFPGVILLVVCIMLLKDIVEIVCGVFVDQSLSWKRVQKEENVFFWAE